MLSVEEQTRELLKHEPFLQLVSAEQVLEKLRAILINQVEIDGEQCPEAQATRARITEKEAEVAKLGKHADVTGGAAANHRIQEAKSKFAGNEAVRVQRAARGVAEAEHRLQLDLDA